MSPCFTLHYIQCLRLSEASSFRRKKLNMRNKLVMSRLVQINQPCSFFLFFSIWVVFHEHSRITGLQGKGEGFSLTPHYHFHPLHGHLDISRAITAESSPLDISSSRTRTGNLWFPSASRECLEGNTSQDTLPCR